MAIQITREEQQLLKKIRATLAAEQTQVLTDEQLWEFDPDNRVGEDLIEKDVILFNPDPECSVKSYVLTKEPLQVLDDDPEVEQAWEDFRAVQGEGHMSKLYDRNKPAEEATKRLEKVLFEKGRLTHMVSSDGHIWVTKDKVQFWKNRGWKEANPEAVPIDLQS